MIKPAKVEEKEERTKSGIIVPTTPEGERKRKKSPIGVVVAVSPEVPTKNLPFKKGDTVLFSRIGADDVSVDGEKLLIIPFENVLAKKQ